MFYWKLCCAPYDWFFWSTRNDCFFVLEKFWNSLSNSNINCFRDSWSCPKNIQLHNLFYPMWVYSLKIFSIKVVLLFLTYTLLFFLLTEYIIATQPPKLWAINENVSHSKYLASLSIASKQSKKLYAISGGKWSYDQNRN